MYKYINDYFEKKRQVNQNQKQKIKLINQTYQSEKIKKMIMLNSNRNNNKAIGNTDYLKNNKNNINNINNISENNIDSIRLKNINIIKHLKNKNRNNMEDKYQKILKKILNMSQENLYNKDYYLNNKFKTRNTRIISASSIFKNKSLFVSKTGKNITMNNYLFKLKKEKSFPKENLSIISTAHSRKNGKINVLSKKTQFNLKIHNNNLKKENKKSDEHSLFKLNLKNYKSHHILSKRPTTTKLLIKKNSDLYSSRKSKEKYVKDRVRYIIKNTRILFTKTKNLDNIVRRKKNHSTL